MQRISRFVVLGLAVGAVYACNNLDEVVPTANIPTAGVRFINAVPDTNRLDMRFVDRVENNAQFNVTFRNNPVTSGGVTASTLISYKPAAAGSRHFKIFLSDTGPAAATALKDTTVTLTAGSNYTALLWGYARCAAATPPASCTAATPAMKLDFFEETVPDPTTNVAIRVVNATGAAVEVEHYTNGTASTGTPDAAWTSIGALTRSSYITRGPGRVNLRFDTPGTNTRVIATDPLALLGAKASFSGDTLCSGTGPTAALPACDQQAIGGTLIAGSAVSAFVFPATVAGSKATNFGSVGASFAWDRRPPKGCVAPYC